MNWNRNGAEINTMASVQGKLLNLEAVCIFLFPEPFMGFWNQYLNAVYRNCFIKIKIWDVKYF